MPDTKRKKRPVGIGELTGEFLQGLSCASWTDEEWAEHDARVAAERAAAEAADAVAGERRQLLARGFPLKAVRQVGEGVSETEAITTVRRFLGSQRRLLVVSGGRGVGKTLAASWWAMQAHPAPPEVVCTPGRFIDAPSLSRWPRYDDDRMAQLECARALVLDDLGLEFDDKSGAFISLVDGLINARYAAMLPTLVTTNMRASDFRARYGERVADRIREVGSFVEIAGASLRGGR